MKRKIPLYLVNGALGAGKTTLLQYLLKQPAFAGARVIENEFAAESVDSALLSRQVEEMATIAGSCICCNSGDELADLLHEFAEKSNLPVIIESTGVANTLKVIEQLVVADIFEVYDLCQSLYVLDALETQYNELNATMLREAQAADLVLVSKVDMLAPEAARNLLGSLKHQGLSRVIAMNCGEFDVKELGQESRALAYFASFDGDILTDESATYSVIETSGLAIAPDKLEAAWLELQRAYGLRRLKGGICDGVKTWHVEATPRQIRFEAGSADLTKLVVIGERAYELNNDVFRRELGL